MNVLTIWESKQQNVCMIGPSWLKESHFNTSQEKEIYRVVYACMTLNYTVSPHELDIAFLR